MACVFVCMILLEPVGLMFHRHGPLAVLSIEQGFLTFLFLLSLLLFFLEGHGVVRCLGA